MSKNTDVLLSVVVPVFNEEDSLPELWEALSSVLNEHYERWEMIFVDDGSSDGSADFLTKLAKEESRVRPIFFRRNFGQHAAVMAGFAETKGDIVVTAIMPDLL